MSDTKITEIQASQTAVSDNASSSVYPSESTMFDVLKTINVKISRTHDAVEMLCGKFEDFYKLGDGRVKSNEIRTDAMPMEVSEGTGNNVRHDDKRSIRLASNNSVENTPETLSSACKTEEYQIVAEAGPRDLVLILDSSFFCDTEGGNPKEPTSGDSELIYTVDEWKEEPSISSDTERNTASNEQETAEYCITKRKNHVLEIQSLDFKAKNLEPEITIEQNVFRISIDVSFYDIENITCVVGDKLDVQARVSRRNNYGSETHEIHQAFEVPALADREKFTACIKNGLLQLEAPMKRSILTDAFSRLLI